MNLDEMKCVACEGGVPPLTPEKVSELKEQLSKEWTVSDDSKIISRTFTFKDFKRALIFTNAVGRIAESEGHHPDIELGWGRGGVSLTTHAIGGLSENDFIVARRIDVLARTGVPNTISIDEFSRVQLRVATITEARAVEESEKLVLLTVDLGTETRSIVAGIRAGYQPEALIGKQVVIVANLEPKELLGLTSHGMVLAADGQTPVILSPNTPVPPGTKIR